MTKGIFKVKYATTNRDNMGKTFCIPNTKNLFHNLVFHSLLLTNLPSVQKREVNLNLLVPKILMVQFRRNYYNENAKNILNVRNWVDTNGR